ncbi:hypothetical protein BK718_00400 [Bacillus thuringiensis serovar andalousiensis]|uniref:Transposase n=1 Tax=Bacillus thuringiensis TaxID=1428 RepID=A0A9X6KKA7_BACTU|nr:hypothetical protein CT43_P281241 [Bacillus thuringiensis serovar chinensis CT-43]AGG05285.1 hypothetical protein H175_285p248 [Bacillus thuringiensis serovar thuringiensis str. IS5056]AIM34700.1 hypothetical protein DF16_pBMB293orf00176 [Bacillus thuringiensis serovar kurstaki str. YBT-1520]AKJ62813.1 hypothetical protein XI92_32300 [Bacillus thuringiensis]KMP94189.1 hypothetical protein TU66_33195 [Bacillus cereus]OIX15354.1 hypothetical protein BMT18_29050 [Bacillus thuringiensis serovar
MFENRINSSVRPYYRLKHRESNLNSPLEEFVYESMEYLRFETKLPTREKVEIRGTKGKSQNTRNKGY